LTLASRATYHPPDDERAPPEESGDWRVCVPSGVDDRL